MTIASRLGSILDPDKNSLKLVRLLAALSVIISHAFEIAIARGAPQLLEGTTPFNLGQHAVNGSSTEQYAGINLRFDCKNETHFGVGGAFGLTDDSEDAILRLTAGYEFE